MAVSHFQSSNSSQPKTYVITSCESSTAPLVERDGVWYLTRPLFACFDGRGAMGQIVIGNRAYQVNVMVGDRAAPRRVADALAAARSFAAAG